jgi:putative Flp pilus-assembly TadE/G-like protein
MRYLLLNSRRPGDGKRRGAVLVMATTMMAGLMVVTAIAVDLSRLFVLRTELQTAADAAALAAALRLNEDPSRAGPSAITAVQANKALGGAAEVDSVRFGVWRATDHTFVRSSGPIGADAAQVTVGRAATYLLGRFIAGGPLRVTARATAWAGAPAMRACVLPWFILHHDYMTALGKRHEDVLTHEDVRRLRDTATNKRWITVRLNRNANERPAPGAFYGMVLPSPYSGKTPQTGNAAYRDNIEHCNTMERGWVAKTEQVSTTGGQTWPGLQGLCSTLSGGVCYNESGGIGVAVDVSIFCTGPEHVPPTMWFQVEWMTRLVITGGRETPNYVEITGYLTVAPGSGEIGEEKEATGVVRTILVR